MTKHKHTPGPWVIDVLIAQHPNGDQWPTDVEVIGHNKFHVHGYDLGYNDETDKTIMANARLIAAAPDILEALLEVREDCIARSDCNGVVPIGRSAWLMVETAIAKAKGQSND